MGLVGVVVRRYIDFRPITYPYSCCISSFLQQHPYFLFILLNVFRSCYIYREDFAQQYIRLVGAHFTRN